MEFLDHLREEYAELQALEGLKRAGALGSEPRAAFGIADRAWTSTFASLALTAATSASLLNASLARRLNEGIAASLLSIFSLGPMPGSVHTAAPDLGAPFSDFVQRIVFAQNITRGRLELDKMGSPVVDIALASEAWRNCCRSGATLGGHMKQADLTEAETDWLDLHVSMLASAAGGGCPCIDTAGRVSIPGWADRRRIDRRPCSIAASVRVGGDAVAVVIRDISATGAGLECGCKLAAGAIAQIIISERILAARIVWSTGERAGVVWADPLEFDDPLLKG